MFFGSNKQGAAPSPKTPANASTIQSGMAEKGSIIFDVSAVDFEERVIRASMDRPVIVDFWAPWCGPCKQLMPALEAAVSAAGGAVLLAKVNLDENPELAQALRVQSVPTVFGFVGGQPVDAFQGVQGENQIKAFIDKLLQSAQAMRPDALDIPEALGQAASALSDGELVMAQNIYGQILQQDPQNALAYCGLVRTFIAAGELEQARSLVTNAPEEIAKDSKFSEAKTALDLAENAPNAKDLCALEDKLSKNSNDHQARIELAEALFSSGQKDVALDALMESIKIDRAWNEEAARKTLLKFFQALGPSDPLTIAARKRLSSLLFS